MENTTNLDQIRTTNLDQISSPNLDQISRALNSIHDKLDDEVQDHESWKYISAGAIGGALQGGLQLIGFSFDQRGSLNAKDPIPNLSGIPIGMEWTLYFLIISTAGAVLGSMASILIIGSITRKNLKRVCVLSAAFGLFFPIAYDFIQGYLGDQVVIKQQEKANVQLSNELFYLTEKVTSESDLVFTVEGKKQTIKSYSSLIKNTTDPKIGEASIRNLEQIGINNIKNQVSGNVINSFKSLSNSDILLEDHFQESVNSSLGNLKSNIPNNIPDNKKD